MTCPSGSSPPLWLPCRPTRPGVLLGLLGGPAFQWRRTLALARFLWALPSPSFVWPWCVAAASLAVTAEPLSGHDRVIDSLVGCC